MVSEVSAIFVDKIIFRTLLANDWKPFFDQMIAFASEV